jgi:folate-dependent tRNA-U54 methylase TrmFO/GidA
MGGMSSSLPEDVQYAMIHTVPGLEHVAIVRNAYAIEYDCIDATNLKANLEFKDMDGLFSAGQINGSSGYEEAELGVDIFEKKLCKNIERKQLHRVSWLVSMQRGSCRINHQ